MRIASLELCRNSQNQCPARQEHTFQTKHRLPDGHTVLRLSVVSANAIFGRFNGCDHLRLSRFGNANRYFDAAVYVQLQWPKVFQFSSPLEALGSTETPGCE